MNAHEIAAARQESRELVEPGHVERGALLVAEDRGIHREKAHREVDRRAEGMVVEKFRTNGKQEPMGQAAGDELRGGHVEVEERPMVRHAHDAARAIPPWQAVEPVNVTQALGRRPDSTTAPRSPEGLVSRGRASPDAGSPG